jgi:hypothetical protein
MTPQEQQEMRVAIAALRQDNARLRSLIADAVDRVAMLGRVAPELAAVAKEGKGDRNG